MFCQKCGVENPDDAGFCSKCGNSLKSTPPSHVEKVATSSIGEMGTEKDIILHRIFAAILDYIVLGILSFAILGALITPGLATKSPVAAFSGMIMAIFLVIVLWIFYGIILETWRGQTVGKMIMGIVVVKENGEPCTFVAALLRNVFRLIDGLGFYVLGFIVIALTEKKQRIGDRLASTVVVKIKR